MLLWQQNMCIEFYEWIHLWLTLVRVLTCKCRCDEDGLAGSSAHIGVIFLTGPAEEREERTMLATVLIPAHIVTWLAGWLADWLTDWLAGWLAGWLSVRLSPIMWSMNMIWAHEKETLSPHDMITRNKRTHLLLMTFPQLLLQGQTWLHLGTEKWHEKQHAPWQDLPDPDRYWNGKGKIT